MVHITLAPLSPDWLWLLQVTVHARIYIILSERMKGRAQHEKDLNTYHYDQ